MGKFVKFFAKGFIYKRDKNGRAFGVEKTIAESGIILNSAELTGRVFRRHPDLLPCDRVEIRTYPIG